MYYQKFAAAKIHFFFQLKDDEEIFSLTFPSNENPREKVPILKHTKNAVNQTN